MPYNAKAIANEILDLAAADGKPLSQMKLQKLVYYAHGWNWALMDKPLLDEQIQAWNFGPVIRTLYRAFRRFGAGDITSKASEVRKAHGRLMVHEPKVDDCNTEDNQFTRKLLRKIWEVYGDYS